MNIILHGSARTCTHVCGPKLHIIFFRKRKKALLQRSFMDTVGVTICCVTTDFVELEVADKMFALHDKQLLASIKRKE